MIARPLTFSVLAAWLLAACGKPVPSVPVSPPVVTLPASYLTISPQDAAQLIAREPLLGILDVRDASERQDGRGWIAGSRSCPFFSDYRPVLSGLDRKQPWLVYCAIGGRAEQTAATMAGLGFQQVYLLKGGFNAWVAEGQKVEK